MKITLFVSGECFSPKDFRKKSKCKFEYADEKSCIILIPPKTRNPLMWIMKFTKRWNRYLVNQTISIGIAGDDLVLNHDHLTALSLIGYPVHIENAESTQDVDYFTKRLQIEESV